MSERNGHPHVPPVVLDPTFPKPGTPEWGVMNRRRGELIDRHVMAKDLTAEEEAELKWLQEQSGAAVELAFPRPPLNWALLEELERRALAQQAAEE